MDVGAKAKKWGKALKKKNVWMIFPYLWYVFFLVFPLMLLITFSLASNQQEGADLAPLWSLEKGPIFNLKLDFSHYMTILKDPFYRSAFFESLKIAALSTFFCLILGYPMAYGIAQSRYKMIWLMLAVVPFLTSFLVRVYAWIALLSPQGLINRALNLFGWESINIMNTPTAIIIGIVYSYLPFMIFPLYAVLDRIDRNLLEAAYDLGSRPLGAFWRVTVPLSLPGICAGASLVFIPAVGEFVIPELLGGQTSLSIGRLLWYEFFTNYDWPMASSLAILMILLLLVPIVLFERLQNLLTDKS